MSPQIVFVTGGTGFIGSHVIEQVLAAGYTVRATARSAKKLRETFPNVPESKLQVVELSLEDDHTEALKGVDALIHCASPSIIRGEELKDILNGAYHSAVDIVNAAIKVGIKKIILTATAADVFEPDFSNGFGTVPIGPETWGNPTPLEQIDVSETSPGAMYVYQVAKTAAEKKVWELADEYSSKGVDITTILPSMVFGPYVPNFVMSSNTSTIGTNLFLYNLLDTPDRTIPENLLGMLVDVRDIARAHVLALSAAPLPNGEHKRLIVSSNNFIWTNLIKVLREKYPKGGEVDKRLPAPDAKPVKQATVPLDDSLTKKVFPGWEYVPFDKTVVDAFEGVLNWEKKYKIKN